MRENIHYAVVGKWTSISWGEANIDGNAAMPCAFCLTHWSLFFVETTSQRQLMVNISCFWLNLAFLW